jgi:hypothetical protein
MFCSITEQLVFATTKSTKQLENVVPDSRPQKGRNSACRRKVILVNIVQHLSFVLETVSEDLNPKSFGR